MSLFVTDDELEQFTGCKTQGAQELALKARKIKHFKNIKGVVLARHEFEGTPEAKRPVDVIPSANEIYKLTAMPRNGVGIYFLCQGKEIVYVGKTTNFFSRMSRHDGSNYEFDCIRFLPSKENKLDALEREYIARFKPKFNKMHNRCDE